TAGAVPRQPVDLAAAMEQARAQLAKWVETGAGDPQNGWAMAHGLIAFGKDLRTTDGRLAVDVLASYATVETEGGVKRVRFARRAPSGVVLAPHTDLIIKKMLEGGVPL